MKASILENIFSGYPTMQFFLRATATMRGEAENVDGKTTKENLR